ncbi:hypothetical protein COV53_06940 [Candidatus Gottesmanbacteria bacterium CG11_big_fil_rev_8_21_14_0_20_37_11]|uniref:Uncharacterized protein n=3 Tax=Candidatus Gottesmaniibacteriota TaxID=1752720 RepID=A0A2M7RRM4_9BACT|nr:MAG: hypothetical protein AUJ73_01640 [Candidatus Gottesmanbacteria bacterium CG1_02_37_22]PIP32180.1 MAG: hypothetical protein COX23_06120 [Candidatus Gottesmanbacteria bacterium CG23_combo_of_CG06-09_8_20_14_all_37_19]PIR07692.1 MAG: hypothetical protein COV53_06940 [Candidatus Gottesmanbacteria bacterium CG11_big_fil_rev_8_21_14_0_20_37_11]PIZ02967.1 MAG: hypothetical protein COY59_01925 [Candidatus Gottesmanbacteria bacterium CG_4_10_14_0_8_um_filter_37_24]
MNEKIIGYTLIVLGLIIILLSTLNVYNVFTNRGEPIKLFNFSGISLNPTQMISNNLPPEATKIITQNQSNNVELIPADMLNKTSNIGAHLLLMGFLISVGFKISSLGTMLVRPIIIKLKQQNIESHPANQSLDSSV